MPDALPRMKCDRLGEACESCRNRCGPDMKKSGNGERRGRSWLRPSEGAFRLFAAGGRVSIKRLAELAAADDMPALGIADTGNLFGALEFAEKMAEKGIQPIVGCQVAIDFGDAPTESRPGPRRARSRFPHLVLIAADRGRLLEPRAARSPNSFTRTDPRRQSPRVDFARLERVCGGADRAHRRARRADQPGNSRRTAGACRRARLDALARRLRRPALCRTAAPRRRPRSMRGARADRAGLCPAACRWLPPTSRSLPTRDDYEAHDALIAIAEGAVVGGRATGAA